MGISVLEKIHEIERNTENLRDFLNEIELLFSNNKRFIELREEHRLVVVGDIHGDFDSLNQAVNIAYKLGYPDKSLIVFLGDYIDRGPNQLECILFSLYLLRENPWSTILLRGNHEPPHFLIPYPHDFPYVLIQRYNKNGTNIYLRFLSIFDKMPLAVYDSTRGVLLLHGGIPVENFEKPKINDIFEYLGGESRDWKNEYTEILWNDPSDYIPYYEPSIRGVGYLWGLKITEYVIEKFNVKKIIRGHEPSIEGFKYNHNGDVITLFSRLGSPYNNERACLAILKNGSEDIDIVCWP